MKKTLIFLLPLFFLSVVFNPALARRHGHGQGANSTACHLVDSEDSYKLAISWQPGFCLTHQDKPECAISDPAAYQAANFTLHGLWPDKSACGVHYEFCNKRIKQQHDFCQYPPLHFDDATLSHLKKVMPSVLAGSCLERHEWFKHGNCQSDYTLDQYFGLAANLVEQFNSAGLSAFMAEHSGQKVNSAAFFNAVDNALGQGASKRLALSCTDGNLVEILINLPRSLAENASLKSLISEAAESAENNCGASFNITKIGTKS
jgi:ribonuclease T2